jgi:putative protease
MQKTKNQKTKNSKKSVKKAVNKIVKRKNTKVRKHESQENKPVMPMGKKIGVVTHFYGNISVGIVKFKKPVARGTKIYFRGATTDFSQTVDSMQFDHKEIALAPSGKEVGIKVKKKVRQGDEIFES